MNPALPSLRFLSRFSIGAFVIVALVTTDASRLLADDSQLSAEQKQGFFEQQIKPILQENCFKCHGGEEKLRGDLDLTFREGTLKGGDTGPAFDIDEPSESLILSAINYEDYEMPPSGQMAEDKIELLTRWVNMGLPQIPEQGPGERHSEKLQPPRVNDKNKQFWSFKPVIRPALPKVKETEWAQSEIDYFILAQLEAKGIQPAPRATKASLIRRVYYNLTGLPPSPEQVKSFVADTDPKAYENLVDQLLDSPQYGEKWARHWLDLVRYAETNSFERDGAKPFVWRYRDYVIRSFNDDKPYDQFIREQLAGDEIEPVTPDGVIATGFQRLGAWDDEPVSQMQAFYDDMDDVLSNTAQVFMGLTVNCARCHDHKIDPIPQKDYYRFLAFFRNVQRYGVRGHDTVLRASVREISAPAEKELQDKAIAEYDRKLADVEGKLEKLETILKKSFIPVEHEDFQYEQNRIALAKAHIGDGFKENQFNQYQRWTNDRNRLRESKPSGLASALCVTEKGVDVPETFVLIRGNATAPGDRVEPGFPSILSAPEPVIVPPKHGLSSGRRLALANWIASPENQLTSRVIVNRIWQHQFGRGIVPTSSDLGFGGFEPTHPKLLDWLAADFVENGWSIKRLQKQLLMSSSFQMSYIENEESYSKDPTNNLFWRFNLRRLSAEEIRDSILASNGSLNTKKMFGPSIYTIIPQEVLHGQSRPGAGWGNSPTEERNRRSIYIHVKRSLVTPLLANFDFADTDGSCPIRFTTTQPTQALGMMNSDFINREAKVFANFVKEQYPADVRQQVTFTLNRVFQRSVSEEEIQKGMDLIESLKNEDKTSDAAALESFCLVALNLNEFFYLD